MNSNVIQIGSVEYFTLLHKIYLATKQKCGCRGQKTDRGGQWERFKGEHDWHCWDSSAVFGCIRACTTVCACVDSCVIVCERKSQLEISHCGENLTRLT